MRTDLKDSRWSEERRVLIGIPLDRQQRDLEARLQPSPDSDEPVTAITMVGQQVEFHRGCLTAMLQAIEEARNVIELQSAIVINNVNEHKLKDNPSRNDFAGMVTDGTRYSSRNLNMIIAPDDEVESIRTLITKVATAALRKFDEVSMV